MVYLSKADIIDRLSEIIVSVDDEVKDNDKEKYLGEIKKNVRDSHLELRMGNQIFVTEDKFPKSLSKKEEFLIIPSGEFALLTTYEEIRVPKDLIAFISIRFRYKILGLINISGFHVDPLFRGKIVFSVFNVGPSDIVLRFKEPMFMIFFAKMSKEVDEEEERKRGMFQGQVSIKTDTVMNLRGSGLSLTALEKRLSKLETTLFIVAGLFIPLFALVIAILIRLFKT